MGEGLMTHQAKKLLVCLAKGSVPVSAAYPYFWAPFVLVEDGR